MLISQNFAARPGTKLHETIFLDTPAGRIRFRVAGIHLDFASHLE